MPTKTYSYPLGHEDPSGVVVYKDGSSIQEPVFDTSYVLVLNNTQVSSIFTKLVTNLVDISSFGSDSAFTTNYNNNVKSAAVQSFSNDNFGIDNPQVNSLTSFTLSSNTNRIYVDSSDYIYIIGDIAYNVVIGYNNVYTDEFGNNMYDPSTADYTYNQKTFLRIDRNYKTATYLSDFDNGTDVTSFVVRNENLYILSIRDAGTNVYIHKLPFTNLYFNTLSPILYYANFDMNHTKEPTDMKIDSNGDLYVSYKGDGTITKIVESTGIGSIYARFEYPVGVYGTPQRLGRPIGMAFDGCGNLYISDDGSSFEPGNAQGPVAGKYYYSYPYIYKIPVGSQAGLIYNPNNAISGPNVFQTTSGLSTSIYLKSRNMVFDKAGNLFINPRDTTKLHKVTASDISNNTFNFNQIMNNVSNDPNYGNLISIDSDDNIYYTNNVNNNINKLATSAFTFTNVLITEENYGGNNYVDLSLNVGETTVINESIRVYDTLPSELSSDTTLSIFTVNGTPVSNGDTVTVDYGTTSVTIIAEKNDINASISEISGSTGLVTGNNTVSFYVTAEDGSVQNYSITVRLLGDVMCFEENTKILCLIDNKETYQNIQSIKKGTLVKTCENGYLAVDTIGHSKIFNPGNNLRGKRRLYKCSPSRYPELFDDLIITGCHSILVDELSDTQKENILDDFGHILITGHKYRLMAYLDDNADPYDIEGVYTIWHVALENKNYYNNYGIYANGLLVETSSKRMMREHSGMTLV